MFGQYFSSVYSIPDNVSNTSFNSSVPISVDLSSCNLTISEVFKGLSKLTSNTVACSDSIPEIFFKNYYYSLTILAISKVRYFPY